MNEFSDIEALDEETFNDVDVWNTECIAFRSFNILQQFKSQKQNWISWHNDILQGGRVVNESYLNKLEAKVNIDISKK